MIGLYDLIDELLMMDEVFNERSEDVVDIMIGG